MRKTVRKICCILTAFTLLGLTACTDLTVGGGFSSGNQIANGTTGGSSDGNATLTPLPEIPEAPEEENIVLPETLDFTPREVTSQYGYRYFAGLQDGEKFCRFYIDLYNACCGLSTEKDVLPIKQTVQDKDKNQYEVELYIVKTLAYGKYGLTDNEAVAVWKTFRAEYPEFYWIDNEVTYDNQVNYTLNLQIFEEYATGARRAAIKTALEAKANGCLDYLSENMTATEMALTIYDYVITSLQYAYKDDGETPEDAIWAHNVVGMAESGEGVCETYAKSFEYLCSLIGIDSLTVGGKAEQTGVKNIPEDAEKAAAYGHAWNVVKIDGVWYNVDATWGDQSTLYREWFGKGATEFATTHVADTSTDLSSIWQYPLPTLSEKTLSPVRMSESDGEEKMYGCIDYAFADITNEQGEYTITLHPDTSVTEDRETKIYLSKVSFETGVLPKAALIKFVGDYENLRPLDMHTENAVTLWSDIRLQDIAWTCPSIDKNGYAITGNSRSSYNKIKCVNF